ncbi:hypothetical protein PENTCL1PPCAC_20277, partial [Pristionchus entomophagus]
DKCKCKCIETTMGKELDSQRQPSQPFVEAIVNMMALATAMTMNIWLKPKFMRYVSTAHSKSHIISQKLLLPSVLKRYVKKKSSQISALSLICYWNNERSMTSPMKISEKK